MKNKSNALPIAKIREDFPILSQTIKGHPLIYLDNGATTQLPECVVNAVVEHYHTNNANVHRGIHTLSDRSTAELEEARMKVATYINAASPNEVVFTSGTTASINLLAHAMEHSCNKKSAFVVTALEHHSNFVPWQQLCERMDCTFIVCPISENGDVDLDRLETILRENEVALLAATHVSNVLGTVTPAEELARIAHRYGAIFLLDAAQSIRHEMVDVRNIDCDFMAFSGHKILAPTGIGVLYGKESLLNELHPTSFGGEMVDTVSSEKTTFESAPLRFEAGTPNYVGAHALGIALDYIESIGRERIAAYEHDLIAYAEQELSLLDDVRVLGTPQRRAGCLSFFVEGAHPFDIATIANSMGLALRSGTQCAQPLLHESLDVSHVVRISPCFYNTHEEIDRSMEILARTIALLKG